MNDSLFYQLQNPGLVGISLRISVPGTQQCGGPQRWAVGRCRVGRGGLFKQLMVDHQCSVVLSARGPRGDAVSWLYHRLTWQFMEAEGPVSNISLSDPSLKKFTKLKH